MALNMVTLAGTIRYLQLEGVCRLAPRDSAGSHRAPPCGGPGAAVARRAFAKQCEIDIMIGTLLFFSSLPVNP